MKPLTNEQFDILAETIYEKAIGEIPTDSIVAEQTHFMITTIKEFLKEYQNQVISNQQ